VKHYRAGRVFRKQLTLDGYRAQNPVHEWKGDFATVSAGSNAIEMLPPVFASTPARHFLVASAHEILGGEVMTVDDFVAERAHDFNRNQRLFSADRNRFNIHQLETTKFYRFQ
jgi:hypothetical protein